MPVVRREACRGGLNFAVKRGLLKATAWIAFWVHCADLVNWEWSYHKRLSSRLRVGYTSATAVAVPSLPLRFFARS